MKPREFFVVVFCLWHMAAVGLYLFHGNAPKALLKAKELTRPYVLLTSQWQKWDIFSPDPIRRVSVFQIQTNAPTFRNTQNGTPDSGGFVSTFSLSRTDIPLWQRAKELKILSRLREDWKRLVPNYLYGYCASLPGTEGHDLRLVAHEYVLPSTLLELRSVYSDLPVTPPRSDTTILDTVTCPLTQ
jgi:hypothetical protein